MIEANGIDDRVVDESVGFGKCGLGHLCKQAMLVLASAVHIQKLERYRED